MNKLCFQLFSAILFFCSISLNIKDLNAGVYFINKPDNVAKETPSKPCVLAGYKYTASDCESEGLKLTGICPENGKYGRSCSCDEKTFQYNSSNCSTPKVLSGSDCNGKYSKCDCDSNVYKYYINADCPVNKVVDTSSSCTYTDKKVAYSKCTCPSQYSETCSNNQDGVGADCDGKYISCKCKSNFIDCGGQKAASGAEACTDSSGTKYTNCQANTCENAGYVTTTPAGSTCTAVSYQGLTCYGDCKRSITPTSFKVSGVGNVIMTSTIKGQSQGVNEQTIIGGNITNITILAHRGETFKLMWAGDSTNYKVARWELYRADQPSGQNTSVIGTTNSIEFTIPLTYPIMQITAYVEAISQSSNCGANCQTCKTKFNAFVNEGTSPGYYPSYTTAKNCQMCINNYCKDKILIDQNSGNSTTYNGYPNCMVPPAVTSGTIIYCYDICRYTLATVYGSVDKCLAGIVGYSQPQWSTKNDCCTKTCANGGYNC